ncbi:VOC family protein [Jongsikchunia kroppenstedtii]|uniref:VOC family protein n=1 Tax=Jongsikchunia kroppenstedtii TaxID=1121721 RepID=UPI00037F3B1D|nr:VOC family protein [Jongsikchunia kroppenstedtii]
MSEKKTTAAAAVTKLGYVGFETPDLDALVDYYTTNLDFVVVDKAGDYAYLTTGSEHHNIVIEKTKDQPRGRTFVGWQIEGGLDDAEKRLRDRGYQTERRTDIGPGSPDTLILEEPGTGTALHLFSEIDAVEVPSSWLRPTKLGHVASYVPDLDGAQAFYQDLLGFRWSDTIGDFFVFLRCGHDHHTANFMKSAKYRDMHHIAYEARDLDHLQMMLDNLASNNFRLEWGPGRHGAGHNIFTYHKDPDGNVIELFTQLDVMADEDKGYFEPRPWHEDHPQYPKTWEVDVAAANSWGPINPAMLDH